MSDRRTTPPGMPPGYNAREGSLWVQIQSLYVEVGYLKEKVRVLETTLARTLMRLRDAESAVEFAQPTPQTEQLGEDATEAVLGSGDPAPSSVDGADPAPRRRRKGGAA